MAEDDFESFDNLDDLDWSDVEEELKANKQQILDAAQPGDALDDGGGGIDLGDFNSGGGGGSGISKKASGSDLDINFLLDVRLRIDVEVGRTQMKIEDLLQLEEQNIMELKSMVGQPLDIRVNEKLVARGEVVVINDKFAIRITDIISPDDRFAVL